VQPTKKGTHTWSRNQIGPGDGRTADGEMITIEGAGARLEVEQIQMLPWILLSKKKPVRKQKPTKHKKEIKQHIQQYGSKPLEVSKCKILTGKS